MPNRSGHAKKLRPASLVSQGTAAIVTESPQRTQWVRVFALFMAGVAVSFLIGKAPAALTALRTEFSLSLFQAGLVVSIYTMIAGVAGLFCGMLADRIGQRRVALAGMALAACASLAGAAAETPALLLATRAFEGLGFFLTVVSVPALMLRGTAARDRQMAMSLWSAYMPLGMGFMLFAGGALLDTLGWRGVWLLNGALIALVAIIVLAAAAPLSPPADTAPRLPPRRAISEVCRRGPLLLAAIFGCYAAQFLIVTAFVPLILVEEAQWSVAAAGAAGAFVIAANIIGCLAAGPLLDRGGSRVVIIASAAIIMAACAVIVMNSAPPVALRLGAAALLSAVGGLIPGVLFSAVPVHAPSPRHIASVNGLMLQGVAFGQLAGPAIAAFVVGMTGNWSASLVVLVPLAAATLSAALALGRLEKRVDHG